MFGHMNVERGSELVEAWTALQHIAPLGPIRDEGQYATMLELVAYLNDEVGEKRSHPLADLLDIAVDLIEEYEASRFQTGDASPAEVLRFLMEQHDLQQNDLAKELGSQSIVSEILRGKRQINARQAKALARRFKVRATAFI